LGVRWWSTMFANEVRFLSLPYPSFLSLFLPSSFGDEGGC
jgi:hypothetical protein